MRCKQEGEKERKRGARRRRRKEQEGRRKVEERNLAGQISNHSHGTNKEFLNFMDILP